MQNTCFYLRCFKCSNFNKTWNNARCDFFFNHLMQWLPKLFWGITRTIKPHIDDWWMKRVRWERRVIVIFLTTIISWSCSCPSSTQFKEWCITFVPCSRDNVNYPSQVIGSFSHVASKWLTACLWNITNNLQNMGTVEVHVLLLRQTSKLSCADAVHWGEKWDKGTNTVCL